MPDRGALQVYSAQHQNLTTAWVDAFSAETGVRVQVRKGQDASIGHQIVAEALRIEQANLDDAYVALTGRLRSDADGVVTSRRS